MERRELRSGPYNHLKEKMIERYFRKWPTILSLFTGIITGLSKLYTGYINGKPILDNISSSIATVVLIFFLLLCIIVGIQNIFPSGYEEGLLESGINYLKETDYSDEKLKIIEKRSEIGINAGETRTLVPIIFFTIITPIITIITLPIDYFIYIFTFYITVFLFFILEVDRSNLDAIIQQVCYIYRVEVSIEKGKRKQSKKK